MKVKEKKKEGNDALAIDNDLRIAL